MLKLYTAKNSICTQKVLITLREKDLPYDTEVINLFANEQYSPRYLAINPKGVVPALDHDGVIVTESTLICEYLDEVFPQVPLVPTAPHDKAQMRKWSKRVDEGLFAATRELSFSAMFREKMRDMTPEEREIRYRNVGDPGKWMRFMSTYEAGVGSPYVLEGIAAFEMAFKDMENDLVERQAAHAGLSGPNWLLGPAITLADVNMMPFVARLSYLNLLDVWITQRPHVAAWWTQAQARPSFQYAVPDQLSRSEIEDMARFGGAIRDAVTRQRLALLERTGAPA